VRRFVWSILIALFGWSTLPAKTVGQEPDSVIQISPILVRVLNSTIETRAPFAISVVQGRELTRGNAPSFLTDVLRAVPGVQLQNRFNFSQGERLSVRGFGPRAQFGVRGVRVLVDGIPATLPDGQATLDHLDLAGMGRVEALRGPAAALYGNAAGGVLHFQTQEPSAGRVATTLRSAAGSHGLRTQGFAVSGTADGVGYRVGYTRLTYDGFRTDPVANDGSVYGSATRHVFNATASLPALGGTLRLTANGVDLDAENPGSIAQAVLDAGERAAHTGNVGMRTSKDVRQGQLGAAWNGRVGSSDLDLAVWGIDRDLFNPIPFRVVDLRRQATGLRTLVRHQFRGERASLSVGGGAEVELQFDNRWNYGNSGGEPTDLRLDQHERVRGAGIFVQARADLGTKVSLLAGLRYDDVAFSVEDDFVVAGSDPDDSGSRSMDAVSPSLGVVVAATDRVELFASIARSFETPTTTELANSAAGTGGFNPDLQPQIGRTFEGGLRANLAQRWAGEITVFRTDLRDGLVPAEVVDRTYYRNAAEAYHQGWELALDGKPSRYTSVRLAYTDVDARFEDFQPSGEDYSGNRIPGLAPRRLDLVATLGGSGTGRFVEIRSQWIDAIPVDDAGTTESPSYALLDLRLGLEDVAIGGARVSPFLGVSNVLDSRYNSSVVPNAFGGRYFEPGPGRTLMLGADVLLGSR
jgi:iron complex outermembrane receptor protein